jgi:hypothetical protein
MASALIAREKGDAIVNVGQPFKNWDFSLLTVPIPASHRQRT